MITPIDSPKFRGMKRVRINSDGMTKHSVIDAETGEHLPGISGVAIRVRPGHVTTAELSVAAPLLEMVAECTFADADLYRWRPYLPTLKLLVDALEKSA